MPFGQTNVHGTLKTPEKALWRLEQAQSVFPLRSGEKAVRIRCLYPRGFNLIPNPLRDEKENRSFFYTGEHIIADLSPKSLTRMRARQEGASHGISKGTSDIAKANPSVPGAHGDGDFLSNPSEGIYPNLFLYSEGNRLRISEKSSTFIFERYNAGSDEYVFKIGFEHFYLKEEAGVYVMTAAEAHGSRFRVTFLPDFAPNDIEISATTEKDGVQHHPSSTVAYKRQGVPPGMYCFALHSSRHEIDLGSMQILTWLVQYC